MRGATLSRRGVLLAGAASLAACSQTPPALQGGFAGIAFERGHLLRSLPSAGSEPAVTRRTQVVIAGAGIAGLAAARALRLAGLEDFRVMELEDGAGGNSRGMAVQGQPCPMGAHYLPVPGDDSAEVQNLLEELGMRKRVAGRWVYDELQLCHSPQERLFIDGSWQEGLLPMQGATAATLDQYRRFSQVVAAEGRASRFAMPAFRAPFTARQRSLAAQRFDAWLTLQGFDDARLHWYLDYCCRDDYGCGLDGVSAWAGLHYFASRHGFSAPGEFADNADPGVLTWPEGNGRLSAAMAAPLGDRLLPAHTVLCIAEGRHGVDVDVFNHGLAQKERWSADRCIVALPLHGAARVVVGAPAFLADAAARTPHAAWVVANLHLSQPLADRPGAPPSWDNVVYGSSALGYVDARHQSLNPRPAPTVLTWYRALGAGVDARRDLLARPWDFWRDAVMAELSVPHPDIGDKATRLEVVRYGHAMAVPAPQADPVRAPAVPAAGRLFFAHSDWSGYSVFEEAFTRGHLAGEAVAKA